MRLAGFDRAPIYRLWLRAGMEFEWDEAKRRANLAKHRIDFVDAKEIWRGDVLEIRSSQDHHGEPRHLAYGLARGRIIAVVFTRRGERLRLISARRARHHERQAYQDAFGRGA
jgi:hypothetical protein